MRSAILIDAGRSSRRQISGSTSSSVSLAYQFVREGISFNGDYSEAPKIKCFSPVKNVNDCNY